MIRTEYPFVPFLKLIELFYFLKDQTLQEFEFKDQLSFKKMYCSLLKIK